MVKIIQVKVPLKIDLAGSWTDIQPYASDYGGEVVNFAINVNINCEIEVENGNLKRVKYSTEMPIDLGLKTTDGDDFEFLTKITEGIKSLEYLNKFTYELENLIKNTRNIHEPRINSIGGFNHTLFLGKEIEPMPFEPMKSSKNWLKKHFIIIYSDIENNPSEIHKDVWNRYENNDEEVLKGLHCIRAAARVMANGLQKDRRELVVNALKEISAGIDLISPEIHRPFRDVMDPLVNNKSVIAWKALGLDGGKTLGILCSPNGKETTLERIEEMGWQNIEWDYNEHGIKVVKK